jgi:hypothetical protein
VSLDLTALFNWAAGIPAAGPLACAALVAAAVAGLVLVGVAIDAPEKPRPAHGRQVRETVTPDGAGTMTGSTGEMAAVDVFGVPVPSNGRHAAAAGSGT